MSAPKADRAETIARLEAALARAEAATPGPWTVGIEWYDGELVRVIAEDGPVFGSGFSGEGKNRENSAFAAAARTEHTALLRALLEIAGMHQPGIGRTTLEQCCTVCSWPTVWPCREFRAVATAAEAIHE